VPSDFVAERAAFGEPAVCVDRIIDLLVNPNHHMMKSFI
jgi:hypothetical protein